MSTAALPDALARFDEIAARLGPRPAVFLDFDGTLAPIVDDPDDARLPARAATLMRRLAGRCPVVVVSGRALADLRARVDVEGVDLAGSHGFEIETAEGERYRPFEHVRPEMAAAAARLRDAVGDIAGARVEEKGYAVAVHVRAVDDADLEARALRAVVDVAEAAGLHASGGKKVAEVRPAVDWHKGRAVEWYLERWRAGRPDPLVPLFVGDDVTDEDAFRAVARDGVGVVVRPDPPRASRARWAVDDPAAVAALLERVARQVDG